MSAGRGARGGEGAARPSSHARVRDLTKQERAIAWLIEKLGKRAEKLSEREWEKRRDVAHLARRHVLVLNEDELRTTADALGAGISHRGDDPDDPCPACATRGKMLAKLKEADPDG